MNYCVTYIQIGINMNPLNSPWNKPKPVYISDQALYFRWKAIEKHLTTKPSISATNGILTINGNIYIAKKSSKFRLQSQLDWAHYTPKTIATAIKRSVVNRLYGQSLGKILTRLRIQLQL